MLHIEKYKNQKLAITHMEFEEDFSPVFVTSENYEQEKVEKAHKDFADVLFKYAFVRVHHKGLSEDLVQETFLKTWKYVVAGGEISTMKAFLYHVLSGLIIDQYRKQKYVMYSLDTLIEDGFDVSSDEHKHIGESIDLKTIKIYIEKLPEKYKTVVSMRFIYSMSIEEISKKLNRTKNSVTVQLHRGLKHIQLFHRKRSEMGNL